MTEEQKVEEKATCCMGDCKKRGGIIAAVVLLIIIGAVVYFKGASWGIKVPFSKQITKDEAKTKTENFIKENLVQPGTEFEIKSVSEENGLYKMTVSVGKQEIVSYLTKDGSKFFPNVMDIAEIEKEKGAKPEDAANAPKSEVSTKSDTPDVKLFVMSYCPYGTQIEKGIIPVLETLGNKIKFNLEFVSYIMHGDKEIDENLRQYCVQKNEPAKINAYLKCFLKKGEGTEASCMKAANINTTKVSSCVAATDSQFSIKKKAADKSTWSGGQFPLFDVNKENNVKYGVQGSPTIVINGEQVSSGRDSASLLKLICSAFNNPPKECANQLSSTAPAPGFGEGSSTGGSTDASCH